MGRVRKQLLGWVLPSLFKEIPWETPINYTNAINFFPFEWMPPPITGTISSGWKTSICYVQEINAEWTRKKGGWTAGGDGEVAGVKAHLLGVESNKWELYS